MVCFKNDNEGLSPSTLVEVAGVLVGRTDPCVRHVMRDGPLDVEAVGALAGLLSRSFEVDGGAFGPEHRLGAPESVLVVDQPVVSMPPPGARRVPVPPTQAGPRVTRRGSARRSQRSPAPRRSRRRRGVGFDLFKLVILLAVLLPGLSKTGTDSGSASLTRGELNAAGP